MYCSKDASTPAGHLAQPVVVVPRVQVHDVVAARAQRLGDEVRREDLAQVAHVDRARRRDARRADDRPPAASGAEPRLDLLRQALAPDGRLRRRKVGGRRDLRGSGGRAHGPTSLATG